MAAAVVSAGDEQTTPTYGRARGCRLTFTCGLRAVVTTGDRRNRFERRYGECPNGPTCPRNERRNFIIISKRISRTAVGGLSALDPS